MAGTPSGICFSPGKIPVHVTDFSIYIGRTDLPRPLPTKRLKIAPS
jgi:hypothetical protein